MTTAKQLPCPGIPVDASGGPTVDPTKNVLDLVAAANVRQDDLREAQNALTDAKVDRVEQVAELRAAHIREIAQLRADHAAALSALESKRIDAIRQVDVLAVSTAADRAQAAINALAATTTSNAENVRNALTTTAATIATQFSSTVSLITERIAALEKSSYEGKGRSAYSDPLMGELAAEVRALREARSGASGQASGSRVTLGAVLGALGTLVAIITLVFVMTAGKTTTPQPVYIQAPAAPATSH